MAEIEFAFSQNREVGIDADGVLTLRTAQIRTVGGGVLDFPYGVYGANLFESLFRFIDPAWHTDIQNGVDTHDLTDELQSAIDSGEALFGPVGVYNYSGVTLGERTYLRGASSYGTKFALANGSNQSAFISPLTSQTLAEFEGPTLEFFRVDANGNNQTGTCHAIEFTNAAFSKATRYGSSGTLRELVLESANDSNVYVGSNRNAGQMMNVRARYSLDHVLSINAYDWRIFGGDAGGSANGSGVNFGAGGAHALFGLNIFSNGLRGVQVSGSCDNYIDLHGCSLDLNQQEGILAIGHALQRIAVIGGRFLGNSAAAANTYSDIKFTDTSEQNAVIGPVFSLGNQATKYLIEFGGTCAPVRWFPSFLASGSVPYGTAVTNDATKIVGIQGDRPDVTGSWGGNAAGANLAAALAALGLITDSTS